MKSNAVVKRQAIEKRIARAVVKQLIASGFALSVDNGGDGETAQFTKASHVLMNMFQTDDEHLYVYKDAKPFGWVYFVYGNDGWDVINDYTTNLEQHLTQANALVSKLEQ